MSNYIAMRPSKRPKVSDVIWHLILDLPAQDNWRKFANRVTVYQSWPPETGGIYYPDFYKVVEEGKKPRYYYGETAWSKVNNDLFDIGHTQQI